MIHRAKKLWLINPTKRTVGFMADAVMGGNIDDQKDDLDINDNNEQMMDLAQQAKDNMTINTGKSSLQLALLIKNKIPIWKYCQHKTFLSIVVAIHNIIWKQIKPFEDVGDINVASTSVKAIWDKFLLDEYTP